MRGEQQCRFRHSRQQPSDGVVHNFRTGVGSIVEHIVARRVVEAEMDMETIA